MARISPEAANAWCYHQHLPIAYEANNLLALPVLSPATLSLSFFLREFPPKPPMRGVITSISQLPTNTNNWLKTQIAYSANDKVKQVNRKKSGSTFIKVAFSKVRYQCNMELLVITPDSGGS